MARLYVKVTKKTLPQIKTKYPYIYLDHGRLEVDDASIKWISAEYEVVRIPIATINCILLGPGTSITHEAVKACAVANCTICWVGEETFNFYAVGQSPTAKTDNIIKQAELAFDKEKSIKVARNMFMYRFPKAGVKSKTLNELKGMEGCRVRDIYIKKAIEYDLTWDGRAYEPGNFEVSDLTNQILTAGNNYLYGVISAAIHSLGYSPYIGFVHSGSPLPFVYDIADLYKADITIDLAFQLTTPMLYSGYNRKMLIDKLCARIVEVDLLKKLAVDIKSVLTISSKD